MTPVKQEDRFGCGVACVAFVLNIDYQDALLLFENGTEKVREIPKFYCREICDILGEEYSYKYIKKKLRNTIYRNGTIVFIKKSKKYKYGHYLVRYKQVWMDSWINFPKLNAKAGFRKRLPGKPVYAIIPREKPLLREVFQSFFLKTSK